MLGTSTGLVAPVAVEFRERTCSWEPCLVCTVKKSNALVCCLHAGSSCWRCGTGLPNDTKKLLRTPSLTISFNPENTDLYFLITVGKVKF